MVGGNAEHWEIVGVILHKLLYTLSGDFGDSLLTHVFIYANLRA